MCPKGNYKRELGLLAEEQIFKLLKANDGFCLKSEADKISYVISSRLVLQRRIYRISLDLGRSSGTCLKRFAQNDIFNEGYHRQIYLCLTRSAVVRLLMQALKLPEAVGTRAVLSHFLHDKVSEAERLAILWHLGYDKWKRSTNNAIIRKQSIQIDGIVRATRMERR